MAAANMMGSLQSRTNGINSEQLDLGKENVVTKANLTGEKGKRGGAGLGIPRGCDLRREEAPAAVIGVGEVRDSRGEDRYRK
jgi:hypothetical protein